MAASPSKQANRASDASAPRGSQRRWSAQIAAAALTVQALTYLGAAPYADAPPPLVAPGADHLAALDEVIQLGYLRGILNKLAEIERLDAHHGEFVRVLRDLARQFQFDAMKELLRKIDDAAR